MLFGLWKRRRSEDREIADILLNFVLRQDLLGHASKAQSLAKLGRTAEADDVVTAAERLAMAFIDEHPDEPRGRMALAMFYCSAGMEKRAEPLITRLLDVHGSALTEEQRMVLGAQLQKIRRENPSQHSNEGFTEVYCCANCGRLHNFLSMPCPHCDWWPHNADEVAQSLVMSTAHLQIGKLILLRREMAKGRSAREVVTDMPQIEHDYLSKSDDRGCVDKILELLSRYEAMNHRSFESLRQCSECGKRIRFSCDAECEHCGAKVRWPELVRLMVCVDNLLQLAEERIEPSSGREFSELVCVLVSIANNALRKQEAPPKSVRDYALRLLSDLAVIRDMGGGAVVQTTDPLNVKILIARDKARDDSEVYGRLIAGELQCFVAAMRQKT